MFLAVFIYHFIAIFVESKIEQKFVYLVYFVHLILIPLFLFSNIFLSGVNKYFYGFYGKATAFYIYYIIFFFLIIGRALFLLYKLLQDSSLTPQKRIQAKYVFLSFLIASIATIDYLPKYGFGFYPFGFTFMLIWIILTSYTIFKHHLMDINIVIQKGLIYSVLVGLITAIYLIFVIAIGRLFQGLVGYQSFIVNLFAIFAIAILFNPLRNRIQRFLDKRFFKGTLESLAQEKERLKQELFQVEKLAYVGNLASSVAHEIKNPLTAIKTFVEYFPQKFEDAEFKERFERLIPQEIKRIENVVYQLLDLSRPRTPNFKPINIINTIDTTLSLLENNLKLKNITVKKDFSQDEITVQADEEQLKQVFLNLFLNSIQAMSEGGILEISINLCPSVASKSVLICVKDNGVGITEDNLKKLFTPFFTTKKEGVGLGLMITKEIISQHRGNIKVESKIGEGTKFLIELPIK
jgi:signal transduction histidine kinase